MDDGRPLRPGEFRQQPLEQALGPRCDTTGCTNAPVITYRDVEVIPGNARTAVQVGAIRLCTPCARRFTIEGRVTLDWERILPTP